LKLFYGACKEHLIAEKQQLKSSERGKVHFTLNIDESIHRYTFAPFHSSTVRGADWSSVLRVLRGDISPLMKKQTHKL
jgi:hypothetical protein